MHELSIVKNIIAIAESEVQKAGASGVERIELDIGQFSGVEMQCLDFAWQVAVPNSVLRHSSKIINNIQGRGECTECNKIAAMEQLFDVCPICSGYLVPVEGTELKVKSIKLN